MPEWLHRLSVWINAHETLVTCMVGFSVISFVGTLVIIPILIVRIPADYFVRRKPPPDDWREHHPVIRAAVLVIKNVVGVLLVILGLILSIPLVPGQGFLTILIGLTLVNFPGKRRLELAIVSLQPVHRTLNWIRVKNKRPQLRLPED